MRTLKVYTATRCQPCQQLKKVLSEFTNSNVNVVTIDVDAWKDEAKQSGIRSVPTSILFEGDVEIARKTGVMSNEGLTFFTTKQYGFTDKI